MAQRTTRNALYKVVALDPEHWEVYKFTPDIQLEETYHISKVGETHICSCIAPPYKTCRHVKMIPIFGTVTAGGFYNYDKGTWVAQAVEDEDA